MNARIYYRVSTEEEQDTRLQQAACQEWCKLRGYAVVREYQDEGYSRDSDPGSRPGFASLMEDIQPGEVIVVYHRDRLGTGIALALLERDLKTLGVRTENTKGAGNGETLED